MLLSHPPPDSSCRLFLIMYSYTTWTTSPALRGRLIGEVSIDEGNKDYKNPQGEYR
jgi:hypothetical protein